MIMVHRWLVSLLLLLNLFQLALGVEVVVDGTGGTTEEQSTKSYAPEVIQLASTFPPDVLSEDLALKVAAKLEYVKTAEFLLEAFVMEYGSAASVMLAELKDATELELLETMGEIVQGIFDADTMFDETDPATFLKEMEEDGFFDDVDPELMDEYRMNPRKIQTDTKEGLMYEFIAVSQAAGYVKIKALEDMGYQPLTDEEIAQVEAAKAKQQQ